MEEMMDHIERLQVAEDQLARLNSLASSNEKTINKLSELLNRQDVELLRIQSRLQALEIDSHTLNSHAHRTSKLANDLNADFMRLSERVEKLEECS